MPGMYLNFPFDQELFIRAWGEAPDPVKTALLNSGPLRSGLSVQAIVEDFRTYMDFFNMRFQAALPQCCSTETVLQEHEERCHRQLDILLHGVLEETDANS